MSTKPHTQRRGGRDARRNQQTSTLNKSILETKAERQLFRYLVTLAVAGAPKERFFDAAKAAKGMVRDVILNAVMEFLTEQDTCLFEAIYAKYPVKAGTGTVTLRDRLDMLQNIEGQFAVSLEERLGALVRIMQIAP